MTRVLFVDDEEQILQGLRRTLRPMRNQWDMEFESNPKAALRLIESGTYDVIVSDMQMPGVTGVDVLAAAKSHCPQAVRIGLSGYAESELVLEAAGVTHQFLPKPCDPNFLTHVVERVVKLQERLGNEDLRRNINSITSLPSLPDIYSKVMREASAPEGTLENVGEIIDQDLAITAKVLQLVNSSFFGLQTEATTGAKAVSLLGLNRVRALVLSVELFRSFEGAEDAHALEMLWNHSVEVGKLVKNVATRLSTQSPLQARKLEEQAMLAGMLHDIGSVIEMSEFQRAFRMSRQLIESAGYDVVDAEQELLGCTHADIGAYLLELWGFPTAIVEAVAYHHCPSESLDRATPTPLTAVHIANALANSGGQPELFSEMLDIDYLKRVVGEFDPASWLPLINEDPSNKN